MAVTEPVERGLATERLVCKKHKKFLGYRRPRNRCARCEAIYEFARHAGIAETRKRGFNKPKAVVVETN